MTRAADLLQLLSEMAEATAQKHLTLAQLLRATSRFEKTRKSPREPQSHAVKFRQTKWRGFAGTKVLQFRTVAKGGSSGTVATSSSRYLVQIDFFGIEFSDEADAQFVIPVEIQGKQFYAEKPKGDTTQVTVRCQCADFYFTWAYPDKEKNSLRGPVKPYRRKTPPPSAGGYPYRNPDDIPGLCKHLIQAARNLYQAKFIE